MDDFPNHEKWFQILKDPDFLVVVLKLKGKPEKMFAFRSWIV